MLWHKEPSSCQTMGEIEYNIDLSICRDILSNWHWVNEHAYITAKKKHQTTVTTTKQNITIYNTKHTSHVSQGIFVFEDIFLAHPFSTKTRSSEVKETTYIRTTQQGAGWITYHVAHTIHGTNGIFTYMNGWFLMLSVGKYTIHGWDGHSETRCTYN